MFFRRQEAIQTNSALARGLNIYKGYLVEAGIAADLDLPATDLSTLL